MIIVDQHLIDIVRSNTGRNIHDTEQSIGIYRAASIKYNVGFCRENKGGVELAKYLSEKYERILRSYLVTGNIKDSKRIVEDSLAEQSNNIAHRLQNAAVPSLGKIGTGTGGYDEFQSF